MYEKSIELLNKAVADEMSAIHQYMYFHFLCDDQGYDLLANLFRQTAIEEMRHVEQLAERILFLKGDVEMKADTDVEKIHDVAKMLEKAVTMEQDAIKAYNQWAIEVSQHADSRTKKMFEDIVADEEGHMDRFDNEMENLSRFGQNYLALQSIERGRSAYTGTPAARGGEEGQ